MFARVRRPRLLAFLLAAAGTVAAAVFCIISRPNPDGYGRAIFCSAPLFFVLYCILRNAGLRFGVWFRPAPESAPVFVKTRRHPFIVVLLLWGLLAGLVGILFLGWFGPNGQRWTMQQLYDGVASEPVLSRDGSSIVYLLPVDDFPPAAASRLAKRLNAPDGLGITFSVLPAFASGLMPPDKNRVVLANELSRYVVDDYPARVPQSPGEKPPYLIWLINRPLYSEDEKQEVTGWHPGRWPIAIVSAAPFGHYLSSDPAKARETFESRLAKTTKRAVWKGLLQRPFKPGRQDIYGEGSPNLEDLDARPDGPLPWY